MINSLKKTPNAVFVLISLLKKLSISVTSFTINREVLSHPDYPSMLSLSDCLTSWNVPNQAFKINQWECDLQNLPFPFIARVDTDGGQFLLVKNIEGTNFCYSNEHTRHGKISKEKFLNHWDGIVLYAEKDEESGEADFKQVFLRGIANQARIPFLVSTLVLSLVLMVSRNTFHFDYLLMLLITMAGIAVCTLLLIHSINAKNIFVQNLCSLGKKNNCNAILKSDAANVTSWLSWSEVGMFYFTGTLICLLIDPSSMNFISWLNLISLPYTVYSIGYQIKIRNWCILCCSVQVLLWTQAIVFFISHHGLPQLLINYSLTSLSTFILCFLAPVAVWTFIKPVLSRSEEVTPLKDQLKKFKYNTKLFHGLISSQKKMEIHEELKPIVLGNPEAKNVITMVSNPFCGPCAKAHQTLETWLKQRSDIRVNIIFATSTEESDQRTTVARHAIALGLYRKEITVKALNDWYQSEEKDYIKWSGRYPIEFDSNIEIILDRQRRWCYEAEITYTPTILLNGFKITEPYQLDDIKYFV